MDTFSCKKCIPNIIDEGFLIVRSILSHTKVKEVLGSTSFVRNDLSDARAYLISIALIFGLLITGSSRIFTCPVEATVNCRSTAMFGPPAAAHGSKSCNLVSVR